MKSEGYNEGYRYDHDEPDAFSGQDYFPEKMGRQTFSMIRRSAASSAISASVSTGGPS